ncbi:MAG: hypothetical protein JWN46_3858 [Acidimicrobiales bacterium]|nr:hypothetical protein [Acidimicrobiales bacterium]
MVTRIWAAVADGAAATGARARRGCRAFGAASVRPLAAVAVWPLLLLGVRPHVPDPPRVLMLGDSITSEVRASPDASSWLAGARLDWSGTLFQSAPCNGLESLTQLAAAPDVVIINYAGNHGSFRYNCMNGEVGQALVDRYVLDVAAIVHALDNGRTRIAIVGAPARFSRDGEAIVAALHQFADEHEITWVDGGAEITPGRRLAFVAACLPIERGRACGTDRPGTNIIRDPYLDHLCPGRIDVFGRCPRYSSGAVRLALQFARAIRTASLPQPAHRRGCPLV